MGKIGVAQMGGGGVEPYEGVSVSTLTFETGSTGYSDYKIYQFPIPAGAKVIVISYEPWSNSATYTFCVYIALKVFTSTEQTTPRKLSTGTLLGTWSSCRGIRIKNDAIEITCASAADIYFTAYK